MPAPADLSDAEFAELDELLAATPEPLKPLDSVMLDGFLCGVVVQPVLLEPDEWMHNIFDINGEPLPDGIDVAWRDKVKGLVLRRHAALSRTLAEEGWFDPLILEFDEDQPPEPDPELARLNEASRAVAPWVAGFHYATMCIPDLSEMTDDAVMSALARLYRHLPAETDEEREVVAMLDREHPLKSLDDAMEELVATVADLYDLTTDQRYRVATVRRDGPKVGRNDPCPCGSGKKFKQCHGAG